MEIHARARNHGVPDEDIKHAHDHSTRWVQVGEDPDRYLLAGPDLAGNLLELVVLRANVDLVIHAMPLRPVNRKILFPKARR